MGRSLHSDKRSECSLQDTWSENKIKFALNTEKFLNNHTFKHHKLGESERKARSYCIDSNYLNIWRLSLHCSGSSAQRLSGDRCGPHSFSSLLILLLLPIRYFPEFVSRRVLWPFLENLIFFADRDLVPALCRSLWEKLPSDLQPGWMLVASGWGDLLPMLRIRIRDPVPFLPRDPGWLKNRDPGWITWVIFPRA